MYGKWGIFMEKPAVHLLTQRYCRKLVGPLPLALPKCLFYRGEEGVGAPLLAGAILWDGARPFPYMVRRSCPGYAPVSSLKVFEGL